MDEGWYEDAYLILFSGEEVPRATDRYGIAAALPGFQVIGLRGWDDLIVRDESGQAFTIPAVPCDAKHLSPFHVPVEPSQLAKNASMAGKIKWYVKPIVFGGDAAVGPNLTWVTHDKHAELVRWWNDRYRTLAAKVVSNRKDPLQVSGDIVNTRPSGTKPR